MSRLDGGVYVSLSLNQMMRGLGRPEAWQFSVTEWPSRTRTPVETDLITGAEPAILVTFNHKNITLQIIDVKNITLQIKKT